MHAWHVARFCAEVFSQGRMPVLKGWLVGAKGDDTPTNALAAQLSALEILSATYGGDVKWSPSASDPTA